MDGNDITDDGISQAELYFCSAFKAFVNQHVLRTHKKTKQTEQREKKCRMMPVDKITVHGNKKRSIKAQATKCFTMSRLDYTRNPIQSIFYSSYL